MRRVLGVATALAAAFAGAQALPYGERPAIERHLDQAGIDAGHVSLADLIRHGQRLFDARFNTLDGVGRPRTTGHGEPRAPNQPAFIRTSGPDASSCMDCHFLPRSGGGAGFAGNVFVLAQELDPVSLRVDDRRVNERGSLGMFGAGAIELLAREMTTDLIAIRDEATLEARQSGHPARRKLVTKEVSFGEILVHPDGLVDPEGIDGVDWDLIVKPFHQKGVVVSLREFSVTAMNHHHGMQAQERFGFAADPDGDGVRDELTVGDITAAAIYQAALGSPGRVLPSDPERRAAFERGEALFGEVGCAQCHRPKMPLRDPVFREPGPYNPVGTFSARDIASPFSFDLTRDGPGPHLERQRDGSAVVRAFTDLKRHDLSDGELKHFANEQAPQGLLIGFAGAGRFIDPPKPRPTREFLTRKLWDAGDGEPYGHRGDLTTLTEAIHFHGGDARRSRDAFFSLGGPERAAIVEFLKCLRILPANSPLTIDESALLTP